MFTVLETPHPLDGGGLNNRINSWIIAMVGTERGGEHFSTR